MEKESLRKVAEYLVGQLVDKPEKIEVKEVETDGVTVLEFRLDRNDVGKVLGKKGMTVECIRHLLHCLASRQKKKIILQIESA